MEYQIEYRISVMGRHTPMYFTEKYADKDKAKSRYHDLLIRFMDADVTMEEGYREIYTRHGIFRISTSGDFAESVNGNIMVALPSSVMSDNSIAKYINTHI